MKDILIACVDGLKGFPEAIEAIYPRTEVRVSLIWNAEKVSSTTQCRVTSLHTSYAFPVLRLVARSVRRLESIERATEPHIVRQQFI